VKNKESFNNLPPVEGMLSYREDNEKLYVKKGKKWDVINTENEVGLGVSLIPCSNPCASLLF
jgi:hypothetical protein